MIILQGVTINELLEKIESIIEKKLELQMEKLVSEIVPKNKYLTRTEVSELLRIPRLSVECLNNKSTAVFSL
jgi:hypothetical protein